MDSLYNKLISLGVTPDSKSLDDILKAMNTISTYKGITYRVSTGQGGTSQPCVANLYLPIPKGCSTAVIRTFQWATYSTTGWESLVRIYSGIGGTLQATLLNKTENAPKTYNVNVSSYIGKVLSTHVRNYRGDYANFDLYFT